MKNRKKVIISIITLFIFLLLVAVYCLIGLGNEIIKGNTKILKVTISRSESFGAAPTDRVYYEMITKDTKEIDLISGYNFKLLVGRFAEKEIDFTLNGKYLCEGSWNDPTSIGKVERTLKIGEKVYAGECVTDAGASIEIEYMQFVK
jgi:hypothetical protein